MPRIKNARWAAFGRVGGHPRLRRLLLAYFGFSCVEWGAWVVVLVFARTVGDATTVGFVAVAQLLPAALLAPTLAGRLGRFPRPKAMTIVYAGVAVALTATSVAMVAGAHPGLVVALAAGTTVLIAQVRPAHHSLTPLLVESPADLVAANVVATSAEGMGLFIGPAATGLIMAVASPGWALAVCAAVIMSSTFATAWTRMPASASLAIDRHRSTGRSRWWHPSGEGALPVVFGGAQGFLEGAVDVLIVLLAIDVLALGEQGAGYLNAAIGAGAVAGGLASSALVGRVRLAPPLLVGSVATGVAMALVAVMPVVSVFLALMGVAYSLNSVTNQTLLQRLTPVGQMGSAFGFLEGASLLGLSAGALAAPLIAAWVGVPAAFAVLGLVLPLIAAGFWPRLRRADGSVVVPTTTLETLRRVEMLRGLQPQALEAMARGATVQSARAGDVIVREGEPGAVMFVIQDGSVEVTRDGVPVADLGPSGIFGEIALLTSLPRIATVTARQATSLVVVGRDAFLAGLATTPAARSAVEQLAARRRQETLGEAP